MRPPSGPARSSSIPPSPAIRKSSPTRPIPARSSSSPTRKSATTEPAPPITNPPRPYIEGLVVREFSAIASNWRSDAEADSFLAQRRHSRGLRPRHPRAGPPPAHPRRHARRAFLHSKPMPHKLVEKARSIPSMAGLDLASRVSTAERYEWTSRSSPARPPNSCGAARAAHITWSPTISASSTTFCAAWCRRAAASPWSRRSPPPKTCWR